MTRPGTPLFAAIGHQENWRQVEAIVNSSRGTDRGPIALDDLKQLMPYIPPRTVSRFQLRPPTRTPIESIYVDSFIDPDRIAEGAGRQWAGRIRAAIAAAEREGARLATLGGFTSILYEMTRPSEPAGIAVTTGNSLTAALILRGIERAAALLDRDLAAMDVLVIGATGDVGSAVTRGLAPAVGRLRLAARNAARLDRFAGELRPQANVDITTDVASAIADADLILSAASTATGAFDMSRCRPDAIICDAGYPKNLRPHAVGRSRLFWGGMGRIAGGFPSHDSLLEQFYTFPVENVAHGCILEGAVLALAGRFESYSSGRGRIYPSQVEEIWSLALANGVGLAPLFNADGLWPEERADFLERVA